MPFSFQKYSPSLVFVVVLQPFRDVLNELLSALLVVKAVLGGLELVHKSHIALDFSRL